MIGPGAAQISAPWNPRWSICRPLTSPVFWLEVTNWLRLIYWSKFNGTKQAICFWCWKSSGCVFFDFLRNNMFLPFLFQFNGTNKPVQNEVLELLSTSLYYLRPRILQKNLSLFSITYLLGSSWSPLFCSWQMEQIHLERSDVNWMSVWGTWSRAKKGEVGWIYFPDGYLDVYSKKYKIKSLWVVGSTQKLGFGT